MRFLAITVLACLAVATGAVAAPSLDSDKPIDISADSLEVQQQEKRAIFTGNVIAKQGNITMQSGRMVVYYSGEGASSAAAGATSISRIEAEGGVFFTSPKETAKGSRAIYEVAKEQIQMIGDVTLTREQSVVKGAALVYNLKTGHSMLTSGGQAGQSGQGRVRGLFVPGQK